MKDNITTVASNVYSGHYRIAQPSEHDGTMPDTYRLDEQGTVPPAAIEQLERDGVVCLRQVLDAQIVARLREESDQAVAAAGDQARFVGVHGDQRIFYYEFNLWRRWPVLKDVVFNSHLADLAASLLRSKTVTLYYTNTFVKDAGAPDKVTPWHEDASYSRFMGEGVINMNISFDSMPAETTLKFKRGSHRSDAPLSIGPTFEPGVEYADAMPEQQPLLPVEELDRRFQTVYWSVEPGDALVFYQRTLHAGPGNSLPTRRHSCAFNFAGDDVRYDAREVFVDSPDVDPNLRHGQHPAGGVFPRLR